MPQDHVLDSSGSTVVGDEIGICNLALLRIGNADNYLVSLDDATKEARACKLLYQHVLNLVLMKGPWKCSIYRETLTADADATAPTHEWLYRYEIPSDCILINTVSDSDDEQNPDLIWKIEGQYIVSNSEGPIYVSYVRNSMEASVYTPNFIELLVAWLAYELSPSLTVSEQTIKRLEVNRDRALAMALGMDRKEGYVEDAKDSWADAGRTSNARSLWGPAVYDEG